MKVTIEKLVRTEIEVEIPEKCPNPECGADFNEGSLQEIAWNDVAILGSISADGPCGNGTEKIFEAAGSSDFFDSYIVTGYRCTCGHVLASTEDSNTDGTGLVQKKGMKISEVKARIKAIKAAAHDDEKAHNLEDNLYRNVLRAIARSEGDEPASLAKAALAADKIKFSRWTG